VPKWHPASAWTPPEAGVIDMWRISLRVRPEDWEVIDPEEAERARRIIIHAKRDQKASARAHLRRILGRYVEREPASLSFAYGEHGKPTQIDAPG
jgi:4'-phosphopantetheinyl transferase